MKFAALYILWIEKKKISLCRKVGARTPRFCFQVICHIFHMGYPPGNVMFCCDVVYLPRNYKAFTSYLICKNLKGGKKTFLQERGIIYL